MAGSAEWTLGFIALCDAAPLIVAQELGYFQQAGLKVRLSREPSWSNLRDKLAVGALDGAQLLAPMALTAESAAQASEPGLRAVMKLNANGAAVTLGRPAAKLGLAALVEDRKRTGSKVPVLATVFPDSIHTFLMRHWVQQCGLDPDRDVRLVTAPPERMIDRLAAGDIDGFCAGAPWNAVAEWRDLGTIVTSAMTVWPGAIDKVLVVRKDLILDDAARVEQIIGALMRAAIWAQTPENRTALLGILSRPEYLGEAAMAPGALADVEFLSGEASVPTLEDVHQLVDQLQSSTGTSATSDIARALTIFRGEFASHVVNSLKMQA
jgi:ABC-type nitrate/sulfonate/bicarbonate transport system substrate-binding protein